MGNLIADAILARTADQGIQVAIVNGGGIRASIDARRVTMGEVLTVLPFQNTLSTFQVTGETLMAALENGVSQVEEGAGRFPQVAGMTFAFDASQPAGSRVSDVTVGGAPLDPAATYGVVSNNYVRNGGDGYAMFRDAANAYDFGPDLADVTAEYLAANAPYAPYTDGRITVKRAGAATRPPPSISAAAGQLGGDRPPADDVPHVERVQPRERQIELGRAPTGAHRAHADAVRVPVEALDPAGVAVGGDAAA